MCLFLIFALTFMLSAQQNAIGEEAQDLVIETLGKNTVVDLSSNQVAVPFMSNIPGGLKPKMTFIIHGLVPENASSFEVNFMAGSDIVLQINPRLSEGKVVRNSFLKGSWGPREVYLPFTPFKKGKFFELSITIGKYAFIVSFNHEFLFSYDHRFVDFPCINILKIIDVILYHVQH